MKILSIFLSSINKYGLKFLILILIYEIFNLYRLRFSDYIVLNSTKKNFEPTVPTPYYCLSLLKNNILKKKIQFYRLWMWHWKSNKLCKKSRKYK